MKLRGDSFVISTMMEMTTWHGVTCRVICQNGQEKFAEYLVDGEASTVEEAQAGSSHEPPDPEPPPKVVSGKHTAFILTSRRTEIAKSAEEPKLQGLPAESAPAPKYTAQEILVT